MYSYRDSMDSPMTNSGSNPLSGQTLPSSSCGGGNGANGTQSSLEKEAHSSLSVSSHRSSNRPLNGLANGSNGLSTGLVNGVINSSFKYPPSIQHTASGSHSSSSATEIMSNVVARRNMSSSSFTESPKGPTQLDVRDDFLNKTRVYRRKPRNVFFSQLYSIFHIACTIALLRISASDIPNRPWFTLTVYYYYGYLLGTSILFIILIRCWTSKDYFGAKDDNLDNTSILFGSIGLGLVQLITIGLNLAQCLTDEFVFIPILQFLFVFLLMHFIFSRAQHGPKYSLNNLAIAHLFACQLSLWIVNFDPHYGSCGFHQARTSMMMPSSSINRRVDYGANYQVNRRENFFPSSFTDLLLPILHNYQLLASSILGYMWIQNNQRDRYNSLKPRLLSELEDNGSFNFAKKPNSIKGFFMGILIISTALIVLLLGDAHTTLITHTSIEALSAMASLIGLFIRGRKRKGLHKIADPCLDPNENLIMSLVTVTGAYTLAIYNLVNDGLNNTLDTYKLLNNVTLILQITFQTLLIRSDGRKIHRTRDIYAYLILSNFSLWILEITNMATNLSGRKTIGLDYVPQLLVTLNRFYSGLVFAHFWRIK
ncbi:uncharacterized protein LOC141857007 isoform X2 [Brevipalpus obovatus]